jgi:hypothetical protein
MFGRNRNTPTTPAATPKPVCAHSSYSGHRQGDKLVNTCSNPACEHTWDQALTPAELGQVKEWTAG